MTKWVKANTRTGQIKSGKVRKWQFHFISAIKTVKRQHLRPCNSNIYIYIGLPNIGLWCTAHILQPSRRILCEEVWKSHMHDHGHLESLFIISTREIIRLCVCVCVYPSRCLPTANLTYCWAKLLNICMCKAYSIYHLWLHAQGSVTADSWRLME